MWGLRDICRQKLLLIFWTIEIMNLLKIYKREMFILLVYYYGRFVTELKLKVYFLVLDFSYPYKLAFEYELSNDPPFEDFYNFIVTKKMRPEIPTEWENNEVFYFLRDFKYFEDDNVRLLVSDT